LVPRSDPATLARATLLADPWVEVPSSLRLPVRLSGSTAGPGAGRGAIFIAQGDRPPVRLSVKDGANFKLEAQAGEGAESEAGAQGIRLLRRGEIFLEHVQLIEPMLHAPRMAFINLYSGCDLSCRFCTQPGNQDARVRSIQEIVGMVREAMQEGRLDSIALTSGICSTTAATNQALVWALMALKETFPDIPLGVEPCIEDPADLERMKEAGADEIKLNLQVASPGLLETQCPDLDHDIIWSNLKAAVALFGRGKVQSNLLVGLGEEPEEAIDTIDRLCALGVLPTLRPVRHPDPSHLMPKDTEKAPDQPGPERLLTLLEAHRAALSRHGLETAARESLTMCTTCGGCGLEPHLDPP